MFSTVKIIYNIVLLHNIAVSNLQTSFTMPEGNYFVKVYADSEKIKIETDESNNIVSKGISALKPVTCTWKKINGRWYEFCPAERVGC